MQLRPCPCTFRKLGREDIDRQEGSTSLLLFDVVDDDVVVLAQAASPSAKAAFPASQPAQIMHSH